MSVDQNNPRIGTGYPQYQNLTEKTFQTLKIGEHLICANMPEEVNGYVITHINKAANGVITSVECEDDYEEVTKLYPNQDLSTWQIEF